MWDSCRAFSRTTGVNGETGVGLAGMHERLNELNGRLELESDGHGTSVRAIVPLPIAMPYLQARDYSQVLNVHPPTEGQQREETARVKRSKLISGKRFAGVRGIPSIIVLVALVSVIMTVGLGFVGGGYLLRAIRRNSRKEQEPLDSYTLPGRLDFDSESNASAAPTA